MRAYIADSQMLCWKIMSKLPFFHMIPNLLVISGVTGISTKSLGLAAIEVIIPGHSIWILNIQLHKNAVYRYQI